MTKQQIKDYENIQDLSYLKMWVCENCPDNVSDEELLNIDLSCAVSDIEFLLDNTCAELRHACDVEEETRLKKKITMCKKFLRKYNKESKQWRLKNL